MAEPDDRALGQRVRRLEARLGRLEDQLAVYQLMSAYGPSADSGASARAAGLWTEDGRYESSGAGAWQGRAEIRAMLDGPGHRGLMAGGCAHVLDLPTVAFDGDRAVARCHFFLYVHGREPPTWRVTANRWDLVRTAGGWRVERRVNQVLDGSPAGPDLLAGLDPGRGVEAGPVASAGAGDRGSVMTRLGDYYDKYPHLALDRTPEGVLTMRMHRDGGPAKWAALEGSIHEQLGSALWHIGRDPENLVVIFTGTGDSFLVEHVPAEYPAGGDGWDFVRSTREGVDLILGFLDLDRPVITIANGPATYHSELPVLGDVVLAADDATFQDSHIRKGVVPADGCHAVWLELLGTNRGRRYLMTAQTLTAQELYEYGVVAEVLPRPALLPRAHEIAAQWLQWSPTVLAYSHAALARSFKRRLVDEIPFGFALEGLGQYAAAEKPAQP